MSWLWVLRGTFEEQYGLHSCGRSTLTSMYNVYSLWALSGAINSSAYGCIDELASNVYSYAARKAAHRNSEQSELQAAFRK